jgi:hypothetical protein
MAEATTKKPASGFASTADVAPRDGHFHFAPKRKSPSKEKSRPKAALNFQSGS